MTVSPHAEGELLFLTDSAYLSLFDEQSTLPSNGVQHDGLFLERLDSFIEGQMRDIAAFADREQHPVDEIRKLVAIPHAKFLFSTEDYTTNGNLSIPSVRTTLARLSSNLQKLHSTAGLESLLLVIASTPTDTSPPPAEASWIGGTELGKEFWMGLKGGGMTGVRAFRAKCRNAVNIPKHTQSRSGDVKAELNTTVRHALRTASGNPSAEMRWTRPASLEDAYGVRLYGWPSDIMRRNPSNNARRENQRLLELVRSGRMRFVSRGSVEWDEARLELGTESGTELVGEERSRQVGDSGHSQVFEPSLASGPSADTGTLLHAVSSLPNISPTLSHPGQEGIKRPIDDTRDRGRQTRRKVG